MNDATLIARLDGVIQRARSERTWFDGQWRDVRALVCPGRSHGAGAQSNFKQYDTTATLAAENLAAGLFSLLTNPGQRWFDFALAGAGSSEASQDWLNEASKAVDQALRRSVTGFYPSMLESLRDCIHYGVGLVSLEWDRNARALKASNLDPEATWIIADGQGEPMAYVREMTLDVSEVERRWPQESHATDTVSTASGLCLRKRVVQILALPSFVGTMGLQSGLNSGVGQGVGQGVDQGVGQGPGGEQVLSLFVDLTDQRLLSTASFVEMPIARLRWNALPNSPYSVGPSMASLPEIKLINALTKAGLMAAEKAVDPPLLTVNENGLRGLRTHPGAIIYGGLDPNGRRLYEPLTTGVDPLINQGFVTAKQEQLREAYFFSLLLFANQTNMTATEFLGRYEEKVRLLSPYLVRAQSEFLEPMLMRALRLLIVNGALRPPPAEISLKPSRSKLSVTLTSPLARAQRTSGATSLLRALDSLSATAQQLPELAAMVDRQAVAEQLLEGFSIPHNKGTEGVR